MLAEYKSNDDQPYVERSKRVGNVTAKEDLARRVASNWIFRIFFHCSYCEDIPAEEIYADMSFGLNLAGHK